MLRPPPATPFTSHCTGCRVRLEREAEKSCAAPAVTFATAGDTVIDRLGVTLMFVLAETWESTMLVAVNWTFI